jgi:opacity protein-like surface antigen
VSLIYSKGWKMLRTLLVFLILITITTSALASETKGYYASISADATFLDDTSSNYTLDAFYNIPALSISTKTEYETGYNIAGSLGYDFGSLRVESEFRYAMSKIKTIHDPTFGAVMIDGNIYMVQNGTTKRTTKGDTSSTSLMLNGFYDFENETKFTPHLMCGLGASKIVYDDTYYKYDDYVFAYQFGAGVSTELSNKIILDLSYRYFATEDSELTLSGPGGPGPLQPMEMSYKSNNISLGIRYIF